MKKRLRKKLHKGEFQEIGISIKVTANQNTATTVLQQLAEVAEQNRLIFCGGGAGRIILPPKNYEDLTVPKKIANLIGILSTHPYLLSDCVLGYFSDPINRTMTPEQRCHIADIISSIMTAKYEINSEINLW